MKFHCDEDVTKEYRPKGFAQLPTTKFLTISSIAVYLTVSRLAVGNIAGFWIFTRLVVYSRKGVVPRFLVIHATVSRIADVRPGPLLRRYLRDS